MNSNGDDDKRHSYKVGFKKPPEHTRFRPGQSGNPRGRPTGSKNYRTIVGEVMNRKMRVKENGKLRNLSRGKIIITQLANEAMKGKPRQSEILLRLWQDYETAKSGETTGTLSPEQRDSLVKELKRMGRKTEKDSNSA
jgi:hypothetical protein